LKYKPRHNAKLPLESLEVINYFNSLDLDKNFKTKLRLTFRKVLNQFDSDKYYQHHGLFPPEQRLSIIESFNDINKKIAKQYFNIDDGSIFNDYNPNDDSKWKSVKPMDKYEILSMLSKSFQENEFIKWDKCHTVNGNTGRDLLGSTLSIFPFVNRLLLYLKDRALWSKYRFHE